MLDVRISAARTTGSAAGDFQEYVVMDDGFEQFFDTQSGVLEIPEDYYLNIRIHHTGVLSEELAKEGPRVVIGDESYYCQGELYGSESEIWWEVRWREELPHSGRPFYGLVGRHEIKIQCFVGRSEFFERSVFVEVLATRERAREITSILNFINDEYDTISKMCLDDSGTGESTGDLENLISEAEMIYGLCCSLWTVLLRQLRHNLEPRLSVTPNGLPNSPEAIHWLSLNSDAIALCSPEEQTFQINNMPVRTDFAAEEKVVPSYRLFENMVIAGFFNHIQMKLGAIINFIASHEKKMDKSEGESARYRGYFRYSYIVQDFLTQDLRAQNERVMKLLDGFFRLYAGFRRITGISYLDKPLMPRITPFVARTQVYRTLFEQIARWYDVSSVKLTFNDFASHFIKIDKLYEFMVLSRIVNVVSTLGGACVAQEWHDMDAPYFGGKPGHRPASEPFNYYRWISENKEFTLELWYEPKIYTYGRTKDNEPMVVSSRNYSSNFYFTPDYVIRIKWSCSDLVDYLIMDAKYSSSNTVKQKSLPAIMDKYLNSVHIRNSPGFDSGIRGLLAIYSRGDVDRVSEYAPVHGLNNEHAIFPAIDGVAIRPAKEGNEESFRDYLAQFIENLRKVHLAEYERVIQLAKKLQENNAVR